MMTLTTELLEYLITAYENATGKKMVSDSVMRSTQAKYYFKKLDDNLIEPMGENALKDYKEGAGKELEEKMRAIRSSSAMTYSLIGNDAVTVSADSRLFVPGDYQVKYEWQYETIHHNPHKANLDAVLTGDEELIFCEMKMTEWIFNKPGMLRESYLDKKLYIDPESYLSFKSCIDQLLLSDPTDYKEYPGRLKQYDAFQMFKHSLAIYNYAFENQGKLPKKIRLVNVVWHLPDANVLSESNRAEYLMKETLEHQEYQVFYEAAREIRDRFAEIGYDFDILFLPADEFAAELKKTDAQRRYLERYFGKSIGTDAMGQKDYKKSDSMDAVLYKDRPLVRQKYRLEEALEDIAGFLQEAENKVDSDSFLREILLNNQKSNQGHHPEHEKCDGFKPAANGQMKEKRICHCMYYYMKDPKACASCGLEHKWKNAGDIKITDFEVPTKYVYEGVGGMDLIFDGKYAVEVKPPKSHETLSRMFAEILTYTLETDPDGKQYEPAICLFNLPDNEQMKQYKQLKHDDNKALEYIMQRVKVFYFDVSSLDEDVIVYSIHPIEEMGL